MTVEVHLLGPFEMLRDGQPVAVSSDRLRALLAVLAMSAGGFVSVETIGTRIWGQHLPDNVRRSVQTYIARLRRLLGDAALVTVPDGYLLAIDPDRVDALRFLRLTGASQDPVGLAEALTLWRGTPFDDIHSDWLAESEAPRLIERYLTAIERRADLELDTRPDQLIAELRQLTAHYPLRESLWARLLTLLDRTGRRAEALASYASIRTRLATELGVDPGPELQRIHARLLAGEAGADPLPGTGGLGTVPRQLPSDTDGFTGRAGDLAALDALLPTGEPPRPIVIVAVHGAGGIGKTALAVHWAHRVRDRFPDGQLFLDLRGYGPGKPVSPATALDVLLRSLGVAGEQIPADADGRGALLRSLLADRQMLIVLDNARDPGQVRPLLPGSSSLVVITSRSQLRGLVARDGAHRVALDQLQPAESVALLSRVLPGQHAWYLTSALHQLAELCGHLPLALRIAAEYAARHPDLQPSDLVDQLRSAPEPLAAFDVADDPAANLPAVFSWSYQALDAEVGRMFRLLGLHPGPDTGLGAAAALLGSSERVARQALDQLTDNHLVEQRQPGRWQLHDLLRAYAVSLVGEPERDAALDRVCDWYLHSAMRGRQALRRGLPMTTVDDPGPDITPRDFDGVEAASGWFRSERHNLAAIIRYAADTGRHRAAYNITHMFWVYLSHQHLTDEMVALLQVAMESARAVGDDAAIATTASQLGTTWIRLGDYRSARVCFELAVQRWEAIGNDRGLAASLGNLGWVFQATGRPDEALERQVRGLAVANELGDPNSRCHLLNNLAMTYVSLGRFGPAVEACREALVLAEKHDLASHLPHVWESYGEALAGQRRYAEAIDAYQQAERLFRDVDDRWNEAFALSHRGIAQRDAGRPDDARASWHRALSIFDQIGAADNAELSRPGLLALLATVTPASRTA